MTGPASIGGPFCDTLPRVPPRFPALPWRAAHCAQDSALQDLIEQTQKGGFGQGFDAASRTIQMPKSSLPTLSPATAQTTEQAVAQYEAIVARGGWPAVPAKDRLRIGARHAGVVPLRQRLIAAAISRPMPA